MIYPFIVACLILFIPSSGLAGTSTTPIITTSIPPYTYLEKGESDGLVSAIVKAMAKHVGHSGKIDHLPWVRCLKMASTTNQAAPPLIIPLNRSKKRENTYKWIVELYRDETVLVTKKGQQPVMEDVKLAKNLRTGVLMASPLEQQLRTAGFSKIDPSTDEDTNARKLNAGRLDVWHVARMVAPFVYNRLGLDSTELQYGAKLDVNDLYLAGPKDFPEAEAKKWRQAYEKIKADGTLAKIIQRFSGTASH